MWIRYSYKFWKICLLHVNFKKYVCCFLVIVNIFLYRNAAGAALFDRPDLNIVLYICCATLHCERLIPLNYYFCKAKNVVCMFRWRRHSLCSFCLWTFSSSNSKTRETIGIVSDQVKVSICRQISSKGLAWFKNGMLFWFSLFAKNVDFYWFYL